MFFVQTAYPYPHEPKKWHIYVYLKGSSSMASPSPAEGDLGFQEVDAMNRKPSNENLSMPLWSTYGKSLLRAHANRNILQINPFQLRSNQILDPWAPDQRHWSWDEAIKSL